MLSSYQQEAKLQAKIKKNLFFLQDLKLRCNFAPVKNENTGFWPTFQA